MLSGLLVLQSGCGAGWRRLSPVPAGPFAPRQQVQVFHHDGVARWHALVVTPDSVSGIPFIRPTDCDSCRVAIPRTVVDSVRVGNPVGGFWRGIGLGMLVFLSAGFVFCSAYGCPATD